MNSMENQREQSLEVLTRAYTSDAISVTEYERRATLVQRASNSDDLARIIADLPQEAGSASIPSAPNRQSRSDGQYDQAIDSSLEGSQTVACVMGQRDLRGDWLSGDRVMTFTLMGQTTLDLRDAILPAGPLRIRADICMGETVITVPRGLPVRLNAFPFMAEASAARDVAQRVIPGQPYVIVEGFVLMGSLKVEAKD